MPLFSLTCGCTADPRSVSVPVSLSDTPDNRSPATAKRRTTVPIIKHPLSFSSDDRDDVASSSPPSFSQLLRELGELERSAAEWEPRRVRLSRVEDESVAVETESEDPLRDFRRSMLQMIVEKGIVGEEELRELLRRFLELNSPRHHDVILRAFGEIWEEVFSGYVTTPDQLRGAKLLDGCDRNWCCLLDKEGASKRGRRLSHKRI